MKFKYHGMRTGRWSMGQAIQTLPRTVGASPLLEAPYVFAEGGKITGFDYGKVEERVLADILRSDDVIYDGRHRAKVISFDPNLDEVEILFNDKDLIPPTMKVSVRDVSYAYGGPLINPEVRCPKCDVPWKKSPGFTRFYEDCPVCGQRKEDAQ